MPLLNWVSKTSPKPVPGFLKDDSLIYPGSTSNDDSTPQDQLIFGDNLAIMSALLPEFEGRINLIYADPPFFTNRRFRARIGRGEDSRRPQDWQLAEGYPDDWKDIDSYLDMLYPRLALMYRMLAPSGTLYLHLDWHADHYARLLLDEIFGSEQLLNEIIWVYHGPSPIRSAFNRKHDTILAYTKSKEYTFNVDDVREPYNPNTVKTFESSPKAGFGKVPNLARGKVPEDWWYFPVVARLHSERTGYPTQKPEALLERIILASSNPGELVADFFCGSGTTPVVATRLGRHFIASDVIWRAVHTTRARLVNQASGAFRLQSEGHQPPLPNLYEQLEFTPTLAEDYIVLPEDQAQQLDYWEVDPNWDGQIFRSRSQVVRPRGKGKIACRINLPHKTQGRVCIRLTAVDGRQIQMILTRSGSPPSSDSR
jgi:DNA modification methylase